MSSEIRAAVAAAFGEGRVEQGLEAIEQAGTYLRRTVSRPMSVRQSVIAAHLLINESDALVSAVAGSGKTSILVILAHLIAMKGGKGVFLAFNKDIVNEGRDKLAGTPVEAMTLHGLGNKALIAYAGRSGKPDTGKYRRIIGSMLETRAQEFGLVRIEAHGQMIDRVRIKALVKKVLALVNMARDTMTDPRNIDALWAMAVHYDLDVEDWTITSALVAPAIFEGLKLIKAGTWDFGDMLFGPLAIRECGQYVPQYDYVLVDECQDVSRAKMMLAEQARSGQGRMLWVGDAWQAIYAFAGADSKSIENIIERTHEQGRSIVTLPLDVTYRCPRRHVALINALYPEIAIEATEDAIDGRVVLCDSEQLVREAQAGALLQFRVTSAAVETCFALIRSGRKSLVRGRDIGGKLIELVEAVSEQSGFDYDAFEDYLTEYHLAQVERLDPEDDDDAMLIQMITDRIDTVRVVYKGTDKGGIDNGKTLTGHPINLEALVERIKGLFVEPKDKAEAQAVIWCSTGHRAKGLEAHMTAIGTGLFPHKMAKSAMAIEQEHHLLYVMLSRCTKAADGVMYIMGDVPALVSEMVAEWDMLDNPEPTDDPELDEAFEAAFGIPTHRTIISTFTYNGPIDADVRVDHVPASWSIVCATCGQPSSPANPFIPIKGGCDYAHKACVVA